MKLSVVNEALGKIGMVVSPMSAADFDAFLKREMDTNGKIIRKLNLKVG